MRKIHGKKTKGGKKDKKRKALKRIKKFKNPQNYTVDDMGNIKKINVLA